MAKRYDPTEYLYASARIRAMELRLIPKDKWNQLLEMNSAEEILSALGDKSVFQSTDRESAPDQALRDAFATVAASVPDPTLIRFLQYPYDCNNIKALEKCRIKGLDANELLIDLGSIPAKTLLTVSENELPGLLPHHMAKALPEAREAFAKTANPQEIDFILDRAAYADMAEAAAPYPFAAALVATKADLQNLLICKRLLRMHNGDLGRAMLERSALPGGTISEEQLLACYEGGEDALYDVISRTPYARIFDKDAAPAVTERLADDYIMELVCRARSVTFGAEVPIAYLMAIENDSKNLRILLAGKAAGADCATIKAKLRKSYV